LPISVIDPVAAGASFHVDPPERTSICCITRRRRRSSWMWSTA